MHLHFGDGPGVWDNHSTQAAPACISWNLPEEYRVSHGAVGYGAPGEQAICTLTTHDPDEAAAEAERLLAGWTWSGQQG
jgi:hypothetical protein